MAMPTDKRMQKWRNFAAWSAVGAIFFVLVVSGLTLLLRENGLDAIFDSKQVIARLGLALALTAMCVGFSMRNSPINAKRVRHFVVCSAVAAVVCLLGLWGFNVFVGWGSLEAMDASELAAAVVGLVLTLFAFSSILGLASARAGADLVDAEAADELRERGRLMVYSLIWIAAWGVLLIGLSLAGPGGVLSPTAALVGTLILIAVFALLGIATWRLTDELGRTLSHETGNMAFYLVLVLGGGWAMLAHLGFMAEPAPIDWLTLSTVLMFVAAFIAAGRRQLLTR